MLLNQSTKLLHVCSLSGGLWGGWGWLVREHLPPKNLAKVILVYNSPQSMGVGYRSFI